MTQADFQDQHLLVVVAFVSVFLRDVQGAGTFSRGGGQGRYLSLLDFKPLQRPVVFEPYGCWVNGRGEASVRLPVPTLREPVKVPALCPSHGRHSAWNPFGRGV